MTKMFDDYMTRQRPIGEWVNRFGIRKVERRTRDTGHLA